MAGRIRSVKPEWLEDEKLVFASPQARVLSIALLLLADDHGNGRANERWLQGQVFPGSEDPRELSRAIRELSRLGFVVLYQVAGQSYFAIRNWSKHQRVDRPGKPRVPGPEMSESVEKNDCAAKDRETHAKDRGGFATDHDHDHDHDHDQDQEQQPARKRSRKTICPSDWNPSDDLRAYARDHGCDPDRVAEAMRDWSAAKGEKRVSWEATFRNFCRLDSERGRGRGVSRQAKDGYLTPEQLKQRALEMTRREVESEQPGMFDASVFFAGGAQ